jgi:hypothetical protein
LLQFAELLLEITLESMTSLRTPSPLGLSHPKPSVALLWRIVTPSPSPSPIE